MSSIASPDAAVVSPAERVEVLFEELAELVGQRNAVDARIVEIVAEFDRDGLVGITGARSVAALVAWKLGCSDRNARTIAAIAHRLPELPQCSQALREGRLSLDQVGIIAERGGAGSDAHYAQLASVATVNQLRTAINLEPRPDPEPQPDTDADTDAGPVPGAGDDGDSDAGPDRVAELGLDFDPGRDSAAGEAASEPAAEPVPSISKTAIEGGVCFRITLGSHDAAKFDAALASHRDALIGEWKLDREQSSSGPARPFPSAGAALMRLVEAGWDAEAARRPHGQHTTVVVHLDVERQAASWHLGPLLTDAERRYLTCDASYEVWFERDGQPLGVGRATRQINRRLRRALEHRDRMCVVPGCGATRGLHAHHLQHWEDGGATELANLVLVCPYHHRAHHRGVITLTGPADQLIITDSAGRALHPGSLARPPTQPLPAVAPWPGPTGERADWWWYDPFQPQPPPSPN